MISLLSILLLLFVTQSRGARTDKPNFIVLFVDDLGYGDLGFTGHPTTKTPNLDELAWNGKILTTWYSGCNICTASRAALMTGRQHARTGLPGGLVPTSSYGLNLDEITIAEHLKNEANYSTAIVGKWHLGQRKVYLPGNQGFDQYLGIPYSNDMGVGWESSCEVVTDETISRNGDLENDGWEDEERYESLGLLNPRLSLNDTEEISSRSSEKRPGYVPLLYQIYNHTAIIEQPVDFTTLAKKYSNFATRFIEDNQDNPFFLYVPFTHVHTTATGSTKENQYAGCNFRGATKRGIYGDALAETDWIVGTIVQKLRELDLEENTLILFTSDNGPWQGRGLSGGSEGLFTGRYAQNDGYWNTGKGSNWEGGIRAPAFAYWKGTIQPFSRSSEVVSSLDVFPTLTSLAGAPMPTDRPFDGRDMSDVLLNTNGTSKHEFLFFYGTCHGGPYWAVSGVRHGKYKGKDWKS